MILNTESWLSSEQDDESEIQGITALYDFYRLPLERAGFRESPKANRAVAVIM